MSQEDNFYMILPSNASPRLHPRNHAADYIVTWENPIYLDPESKWKVAMTEISYIYKPTTLTKSYGIDFSKWFKDQSVGTMHLFNFESLKYYCELQEEGERLSPTEIYEEHWPDLLYNFSDALKLDVFEDQLRLRCKYAFTLDFNQCTDPDLAKKTLGFSNYKENIIHCRYDYEQNLYYLIGVVNFLERIEKVEKEIEEYPLKMIKIKYKIDNVKVIIYHYWLQKFSISFPEDKSFTSVEELIEYMNNGSLREVIHSVDYSAERYRIKIILQPFIQEVHFTNGLNYVLGYDLPMREHHSDKSIFLPTYSPPKVKWYAVHPPQIRRGITNMFVYASICKPIHVGHTQVPLLKNVFIDSSNDANESGAARNYVVINPMYVPVATSVVNSIEINIRNDAGHLVPFPLGAVTTLTIHFKRGDL